MPVPGAARLHAALGAALMAAGRDADAIAEYQRAAALEPALREAFGPLRDGLVRLGRLEEAADIQLRALAAAGGHAEALQAFTPDEAAHIRSQIDTDGPMNRAWEYYVALAEGRLQPGL